MINIQIKVIEYNKDSNTFTGELCDKEIVNFDPFVSCCIEMTEEQYENNYGFNLVGKTYILQEYSVYRDKNVCPIKMTELVGGE